METSQDKPLVAVILVAYGGKDDTVACINSLLKSDYTNYKIILVDNDSPDDTASVVSGNFPDVKIIRSGKNLGFAGGNNLGINAALKMNADYVFLLNNDTEINEHGITCLVNASSETDKLGAMGPMIYYFEEKDKIWSAGGRINYRWSYLKHIGLRKTDKGQYSRMGEVDYLTGCALFVPSGRFDETGKLDEDFWMYYEDADFCVRLKKNGYRIIFNPDCKVWHKISSSTGGNLSKSKMMMKFRSGLRFFRKHSPSPFWFITYPVSQFMIYLKAVKSA